MYNISIIIKTNTEINTDKIKGIISNFKNLITNHIHNNIVTILPANEINIILLNFSMSFLNAFRIIINDAKKFSELNKIPASNASVNLFPVLKN
jgi:hypothetical protein